jgi:glycosyltransferase involved in cell wall biosynthesis
MKQQSRSQLEQERVNRLVEFLKRPTISVIIPNYNHSRFLPRCLTALLDQSRLPDEIIVVDDASTDNSLDVLRGFVEKHALIQVHCNEKNMQVANTMNRGLQFAVGEYVLFTAADDEVKPGFFERVLPLLQAHPEAGLCCGIAEWRCTSTGMMWHMGGKMPKEACYFSPQELVWLGRNQRLTFSFQSSVFKREAFVRAGSWRPELKWCTDCFTTYVVAFRHGVCFVPEVLSVLNLRADSYYHSDTDRRRTLDRFLRLLEMEEYVDVSPPIAESGILGQFGWNMAQVVAVQWRHWRFLNAAFVLAAGRRCLEVAGRRILPNWLARISLRILYGARRHQAAEFG